VKYTFILIIVFVIVCAALFAKANTAADFDISSYSKSIYDYSAKSIDGIDIDFKKFKGKKIMIVNVASRCGYTYQYAELQQLYKDYEDYLVILGFPSNDFLWQEPGSNKEIKTFCSTTYGVTFPMFEKVSVKGQERHPIYSWLSSKNLNGYKDCVPSWNFNKYIIDEDGQLVADFGSKVSPLSNDIKKVLNK